MASVELRDNSRAVLEATATGIRRALEYIGTIWSEDASNLVDPSWVNTGLPQSIRYTVEGQNLSVGSDMEIAPFAELGTSVEYVPPPEYIRTTAEKGNKADIHTDRAGIPYWLYYDELKDTFEIGRPVKAQGFLRQALELHKDDFERIMATEIRDAINELR